MALATAVTTTAYLAPRAASTLVSSILHSSSNLVVALAESSLTHPQVKGVIGELDVHSLLRVLTAILEEGSLRPTPVPSPNCAASGL